jgi:hypothetical protein
MNLGGRIKVALERSGMKTPEACRRAQVPLQSINALMRRDSSRSEFTDALLSVIPDHVINKEWVRTGRGSPDTIAAAAPAVVSNVTPISAALSGSKGGSQAATLTTSQALQAGTSADLFVGGAPIRTWEHQEELPPGAWVLVPRLAVVPTMPGGVGTEGMKTVLVTDEVQLFRSDWIRDDQLKPSGLAWSRVEDDSMAPVIFKGEQYVVDTSQNNVIDGKTYSVYYDGVERARKCFRLPGGGLKLVANNSTAYPSIDLTPEQAKAVKIVGRVVHRAGSGDL